MTAQKKGDRGARTSGQQTSKRMIAEPENSKPHEHRARKVREKEHGCAPRPVSVSIKRTTHRRVVIIQGFCPISSRLFLLGGSPWRRWWRRWWWRWWWRRRRRGLFTRTRSSRESSGWWGRKGIGFGGESWRDWGSSRARLLIAAGQ